MYTNIPHDQGIQSVSKCLDKSSHTISKDHILEMLNFVLTCNNFEFAGKNYLQINGTAMGTRVAPTYANIFMSDFEEEHVYPLQGIKLWLRFIDDIFMIFRGSEKDLDSFKVHLNTVHPTIKFTFETSKSMVNFLDVYVCRHGTKLITDLYTKPTDSHSYLFYDSCHPKSTINSIPYSQFLRLRRNCTNWVDFVRHSTQLFGHLSLRGYPFQLLKDSCLKANLLKRDDLLQGKDSIANDEKKLFLIVDYNPTNPNIMKLLKDLWPLVPELFSKRGHKSLSSFMMFGFVGL